MATSKLALISGIVILALIILAVVYFGVLPWNNSYEFHDNCVATSGFGCDGNPFILNSNISFSVTQGLGYAINISTASVQIKSLDCPSDSVYICDMGVACTDTSKIVQDFGSFTIWSEGCALSNAVKGSYIFTYANLQDNSTETFQVDIDDKVR